MIVLTQTDDYKELKEFFIENEVEMSAEDRVPEDLIKCWKMVDESGIPPKLIGGVALAKREGEFIIDGIAVDSAFRGQKLGKALLDEAISEAKKLSGDSIYLIARVPGFYRKLGFKNVPEESAPGFFECLTCPQFEVTCYPEVMKLNI